MAAEAAALTVAEPGAKVHRLYLALASFTSDYLEHQDVEERVVMPALEAAVGVEDVVAIHQAILANIPPEEMAQGLAVMIPAMNIDDRAALLGGMRAGAPAEVFDGRVGPGRLGARRRRHPGPRPSPRHRLIPVCVGSAHIGATATSPLRSGRGR